MEEDTMATEFGKMLRKIRIENDEVLTDMAKKLNISISYLSAIEAGEREIPDNMVDNLVDNYKLDFTVAHELNHLRISEAKKISIPLVLADTDKKELAFTLCRRINDMSEEECKEIMRILERRANEDGKN